MGHKMVKIQILFTYSYFIFLQHLIIDHSQNIFAYKLTFIFFVLFAISKDEPRLRTYDRLATESKIIIYTSQYNF